MKTCDQIYDEIRRLNGIACEARSQLYDGVVNPSAAGPAKMHWLATRMHSAYVAAGALQWLFFRPFERGRPSNIVQAHWEALDGS